MTRYFEKKYETMGRGELEELQLKRLRSVVKWAYERVPFYRKKLDGAGVKPEDIKSLSDIEKIPFTTKDELRENMPFGLVAVPLEETVELHASSGTTGTPVTVVYTRKDMENWSSVVARCMVSAGLTEKDIFQNPTPYGTFTGGFGLHYGAQKVGALVIPSGGGQSERQIKLMKYYGTTFIAGVASYAAHLGEVALSMGIDPAKDLKVRRGIFGAEFFSAGLRKKISEIWDMDVYDIYGLTEMCGPGVSVDCEHHDGLHIWEDHFYPEIIDPKSGETLGPEEEGELVLTTLTKEGVPILRYRTRDLTYLYDSLSCDCGRTMRRHAPIKGRSDDMLIVSGTNIFPKQIEEVLMNVDDVGTNYQIILEKKGTLDKMTVRVEAKKRLPQETKERLADLLQRSIQAVIVLRPKVEVLDPGEIPREGIKAKRVIDLRPKD